MSPLSPIQLGPFIFSSQLILNSLSKEFMPTSENSLQIPIKERMPKCLSLLSAKQASQTHIPPQTVASYPVWVQIPAVILSKYMTLGVSSNQL